MRKLSLALCALLGASARLHGEAATVDQDFASATVLFNVAKNYEQSGAPKSALKDYDACYGRLQRIRTAHPDWEPDKVSKEMAACFAKIDELSLQVNGRSGPSSTAPVIASAHPPPAFSMGAQQSSLGRTYPWRLNITTRVFVLGHDRTAAVLDPHWVRDNGGTDTEFGLSGYASDAHASTKNPFYVGLPFNDVAHPDLALRWLPNGWKAAKSTPAASACLGRWVEIKSVYGRVCFAQWEAADPAAGDDATYVFGSSGTPKEATGLHISPAVARYLGFDRKAVVSWRFVDDDDVPPGLWMRYDEQAVLFSALHETKTETVPAKGH